MSQLQPENGFVKIYRSILDWDWYGDANTMRVFLHLILTANFKAGKWRRNSIQRGQRAVSYDTLCAELNLTPRNIRTAVQHLRSTGEVTTEKLPECTLFTVTNYGRFQDADLKDDCQPAAARQQYKKEKNNKTILSDECEQRFGTFWAAYPRKAAKEKARAAFCRLSPDELTLKLMLDAIALQKQLESWQENGGQFIPLPATWLNGKRWEDEIQLPQTPSYSGYPKLS